MSPVAKSACTSLPSVTTVGQAILVTGWQNVSRVAQNCRSHNCLPVFAS